MGTMTEMPRRPHQQFTLRLPPELHARLAEEAEREHRSMTGQALHILEHWLAQREREREAPPDPPARGPNERRGTFTSGRSPGT